MSPQITTYSGKFFDITHPDPASICIEDIAHALSLICRGNGHVMTFSSVGLTARCDGMLYVRRAPADEAAHADIPADGSEITGYHL